MPEIPPGLPSIAANLERVRARMATAAERSGRSPSAIRLVVVTKGRDAELVRAAYVAGERDFGENRVEEGIPKAAALGDVPDVTWHMIGHIQSRKARQVLPTYGWVHSVDRMKIARLLSRTAEEHGRRLPAFLECNVSGETTKEGWSLSDPSTWPASLPELGQIAGFPGLDIRGLMTMAPWTENREQTRPVFRQLKRLQAFLCTELGVAWAELSMGMTDDYEVAIEEGATAVRIGRAVFELRPGQP